MATLGVFLLAAAFWDSLEELDAFKTLLESSGTMELATMSAETEMLGAMNNAILDKATELPDPAAPPLANLPPLPLSAEPLLDLVTLLNTALEPLANALPMLSLPLVFLALKLLESATLPSKTLAMESLLLALVLLLSHSLAMERFNGLTSMPSPSTPLTSMLEESVGVLLPEIRLFSPALPLVLN
jgi:hypothetical protein